MNLGRTVFAQLISFLPDREFRRCVSRYDGDHRWRSFSGWDQFLSMAFAQLTYRESLRDIEACLRSLSAKLYHMGFRCPVARSTLADANESRDWKIYADFAQVLIRIARPLYARRSDRRRSRSNPLRSGLDHHRPVPLAVPVGQVPPAQGCENGGAKLDHRAANRSCFWGGVKVDRPSGPANIPVVFVGHERDVSRGAIRSSTAQCLCRRAQ